MLKQLALSSVAAATFLSAPVSADTLLWEGWRFGDAPIVNTNVKSEVQAGELKIKNVTAGTDLLAYCIDIFNSLIPADFSVFDPADRILTGIQGLYTNHYAKVVDQTTSAAFQLAVWEIVYEVEDPYNLDVGLFSSNTTAIADIANDWLDELAFETAGYDLTFWDGDQAEGKDSQDLVSIAAVPVPAAAGLLLLALGGLAAVGKRRRTV